MILAALIPLIAIIPQFGSFSYQSMAAISNLNKANISASIPTVVLSSESDFDTSQWATILFVSLASLIYLIIVAEISIVQTYLLLCSEDYRWQW